MKLLKKLLVIVLVFALAGTEVLAEAGGIFSLPRDLTIIEDEAFMGLTSVEEVTVPEGTTSIGAHAFAHSSLKRIQRLPR